MAKEEGRYPKTMKNLSIYLPIEWVDLIDNAVMMGLYVSRSELIRCYTRKWIEAEIEFGNNIILVNKIIDEFIKSAETTLHIRKKIAKTVKSEKVVKDSDGTNWNIKEIVEAPKLVHKRYMNEG